MSTLADKIAKRVLCRVPRLKKIVDDRDSALEELTVLRSSQAKFDLLLKSVGDGSFCDDAARNLGADDRARVCLSLIQAAASLSFCDGDLRSKVFKEAEKRGIHFLPTHFYSPIPVSGEIDPRVFEKRYDSAPGLILNRDEHRDRIDVLASYSGEMEKYQLQRQPGKLEFYWKNTAFGYGDAILYYSIIRHRKPRRVIEIGSGFSTLLAVDALASNGEGTLTCIEPYPMDFIETLAEDGTIDLLRDKVQNINLDLFSSLEAGDILFIDSTHVSKTGSDVNHEIFQIFPLLRSGVMIHAHDIFFPYEYPARWLNELNLFWNEQYVIMAFLMYNSNFDVYLSNQFIHREMSEEWARAFGELGAGSTGRGSLWITVK